MERVIKGLQRAVRYNGEVMDPNELLEKVEDGDRITVQLLTDSELVLNRIVEGGQYKLTVAPYMTLPSTPYFTFMRDWNSNVPMPNASVYATVTDVKKDVIKIKAGVLPGRNDWYGWVIKSAILEMEEYNEHRK